MLTLVRYFCGQRSRCRNWAHH